MISRTLTSNALQLAGRTDEADQLARTIPGPEALLVRARADVDRGRPDRAEQLLFDALQAAERAHDDVLVATLWVDIVLTTGAQKQRFDLALSNARAADAALARIEPSVDLRMRYGYAFGGLLLAHGQLDEARKRLEAVLPLGGDDLRRQAQRGQTELALCDVDRQQGKLVAARERCTTGMARLEEALGPHHIRVAISLSQTGALAFTEHDLAAAENAFQRAVTIFEKRGATEHFAYAQALSNLAAVSSERDQLPRAHELYTRSLAMFDAHHPAHPQRLQALNGLASIALRQNKPDVAIPFFIQIRDARRAILAPENPSVLSADYNLALAYRANKQPAEAEQLLAQLTARALTPGKESWGIAARSLDLSGTMAFDRRDYAKALALQQQALAALTKISPSIERAYVLRHIGQAHMALKQPKPAIAPLEEALAILTKQDGDDYDRGTTRFTLGRALLDGGGDRKRAIALVHEAVAELARAQTGGDLAGFRARALAWLKRHGG